MDLIPHPLSDDHKYKGLSARCKEFFRTSHFALRTFSSPLLRQIVGAGMGALIALIAYEAFAFVSPYMDNMFTHDTVAEQKAVMEETQDAKMDRVGALAAEKLNSLRTSAPEMFGNE